MYSKKVIKRFGKLVEIWVNEGYGRAINTKEINIDEKKSSKSKIEKIC